MPITVDGDTVGVLYGVIKLDKLGERYSQMAEELDAQLFVYDKENGDLVIDTIHNELGNISFLKDRKYNDNYSYEEMIESENLDAVHYLTENQQPELLVFSLYTPQCLLQTVDKPLGHFGSFPFLVQNITDLVESLAIQRHADNIPLVQRGGHDAGSCRIGIRDQQHIHKGRPVTDLDMLVDVGDIHKLFDEIVAVMLALFIGHIGIGL